MSGTSLDGVDAVLVDFNQKPPQLINSHSHEISPKLKEKLLDIIKPDWTGSLATVGVLHQQLGKLFADSVNQLLQLSKINSSEVTAIGSHGQTLWHQPQGEYPFSLQLGDANLIAELTNITTIADFRNRDIAAGGQGAPLVPAFHREFLAHSDKNRVILNIGGIANITTLPAANRNKKASGFDTGPGNGLIDAWIQKQKNINYDKGGNWGKSGKILPEVIDKLLNDNYFSLSPPKSTGKEVFNLAWLKQRLGAELIANKPENIQATLTELTAKTISGSIDNCDELFVCGGGIHNQFLQERLQHHLPKTVIASTTILGIDPDWMEAIAFSWLAKQAIEGKPGNLPEVTGASGSRVLGAIYHS